MKTVVLTIFAVFLSAAAHAEALYRQNGAFDGPFVVVQFGTQSRKALETNVQTSTQPGPSLNQPDALGKGGVMQIQGGYGRDLGQRFNLSAAAFAEFGRAGLDVTHATYFDDQVQQDIRNRIGLYVSPGIYLGPKTLIYTKIGISQASHNYNRADYGIALSERISGQIFGVGLKKMVGDKMFWTIDYTRVNYGLSKIGMSVPLDNFLVDVRSRAITEDVSVGFGYQF